MSLPNAPALAPAGLVFGLVAVFVGLVSFAGVASNVLAVVVFAELAFAGVAVGIAATSVFLGSFGGISAVLCILCAAAVDSAIGLMLVLNVYRFKGSVSLKALSQLRR